MLTTITAGRAERIDARPHANSHRRFVSAAMHWLAGWAERRRQLRALSELDEHLLRDIGLRREDVRRARLHTFWTD